MKDFDALKDIWHNQAAQPKVSHEDVLKRVGKAKTALASRLLLEIGGMSLAVAMLAYVWSESPFRMWTTHLAMLIFIVCCVYYIVALLGNYRQISYDNLMNQPDEYILYLKKYKHDRFILNTRKYRVYSLFLTVGFILYFIEIAFVASLWITITGVIFTITWIAVCYFILMRSYIRREEARLEEMIQNLERLEKQFQED